MYNNILVPTDGSQGAKVPLKHGIEIASQWDAPLHTLFVVDRHWHVPDRCSKRSETKDAKQYETWRWQERKLVWLS